MGQPVMPPPGRHARAGPRIHDLWRHTSKTWMAGTSPAMTRASLLRLGEAADEAGGALGVSAIQRLDDFVAGHGGLQRLGLEIGGNQRERVMMPVAGRRAWPLIGGL